MNKVCVEGQRMYFYRHPEPIPKSQVNFSRIEFDMDETWGSFLSVVAQFIQNGEPKNVQVKDGYCFVPPELEVGAFELCLRGDDGESVVASVNRLTFEVCEGFDPSGEAPLPPSPDLYTQLVKEIDSGKKIAQSVREDADSGLFNGERGADGGWYTPSVTQTDENTLRMDFTPSEGDMPDVEHTNIMLPDGGGGGITITNTAAIGQTIKITAVDETGHPTEWEAVDMAGQVQPDWNQNDSTQPDYVKNRTHYYSVREIATFSPVNPTEQVLLVPYSDIPELVCVDINGQRFEGLSRNYGYIGDQGAAGWDEGKGYGFYFTLDKSTKNTRCAVDTRRFGVRPNCILYGMYVDKKIPYYYLPRPTAKTPGAVKAEYMNDLSKHEPCVIDDTGTVYSRKYAPAQVFSDLSRVNLNKLSYDGDHGIFTDSISEEISSVSELVLPVHVWRIFYNGRYIAYLLESADGQIVKFTYNLGGSGNTPKVEVLRTPSSGGSLIVTYNPDDSTGATATHSPSEIYEAFQSGKTVQFYMNETLFQLVRSTANKAIFTFGGFLEGILFMTIIVNDSSEIMTLGPAIVPHYLDEQDYIELPPIVLGSSTEGSTRQFKLTVDDSGTITATEVM